MCKIFVYCNRQFYVHCFICVPIILKLSYCFWQSQLFACNVVCKSLCVLQQTDNLMFIILKLFFLVPIILKLFIWYLFLNYSGNNLPRPTHRASFLGVSYVVTSALDGRVQGEKIASASILTNSCQLSLQKAVAQYDVIVVNIIISTLNSVCQAHHMFNTH